MLYIRRAPLAAAKHGECTETHDNIHDSSFFFFLSNSVSVTQQHRERDARLSMGAKLMWINWVITAVCTRAWATYQCADITGWYWPVADIYCYTPFFSHWTLYYLYIYILSVPLYCTTVHTAYISCMQLTYRCIRIIFLPKRYLTHYSIKFVLNLHFTASLHFWLDANCISLSQYLYWIKSNLILIPACIFFKMHQLFKDKNK